MKIDIGDGTRLYVDTDGRGLVPDGAAMRDRPTVLLLHGGPGADHAVYKGTPIERLTDVAQLVYYDHRGNGRSDRSEPSSWTLDTWADDVVRLSDALGIEHPVVFGASFGGMVAQRYVARHPEHPAKIILCCTSSRLDIDTIEAAFTRFGGAEAGAIARRFWEGDPDALGPYFQSCMPLYTVHPVDTEAMLRTSMNMEVLAHFQAGEQQGMDLRAGLAAARCPVLVIGGELDPVCPIEMSDEVAASLPPELVQLERLAGHSHMDLPGDAGTELVRRFITS